MRIFSIDNYGETENLVVYDESELVELHCIGAMAYIKCKKADFEKYLAAREADEDFAYHDCGEWFDENNIGYREWVEAYATRDDLKCEDDETLVCDGETFDYDILDYDLMYEYWDGSNWIKKTVVDVYGDSAYEATENYPGIKKINTIKGEYEDGMWRECRTGQYDIYKDNDDNWYIVYNSYYQGQQDYIKSIEFDDLVKKFGADEFEEYVEKK